MTLLAKGTHSKIFELEDPSRVLRVTENVSKIPKRPPPHPNIIVSHKSWLDDGRFFEILERGEPLPVPMGLEEVRRFIQEGTSVLQFLHSQGIYHCDVKVENFVVVRSPPKNVVFKLIDFDSMKDDSKPTKCGTPAYMAPEGVTKFRFIPSNPEKRDMWAFGASIFKVLTGVPLFHALNVHTSENYYLKMKTWKEDKEGFLMKWVVDWDIRCLLGRLLDVEERRSW